MITFNNAGFFAGNCPFYTGSCRLHHPVKKISNHLKAMSMKVSLNQFNFYRLNLNNRLVNCQKILLIKRKIFNTLGNLILTRLLNAKWKEWNLTSLMSPLLHKLCSSQKRFCVFDTKSRFSRILIFFAILFFFARSTKHQTYR